MFGRKPQLPIDALLGTAEEDVREGSIGEWIQDQQEFLQFAFASAETQLKNAAAQRARQQQTEVAPILPAGTIVYRRRHAPGRNKIQDVWDSTRYQITKCLDNVGRVYTIIPMDDQGPAKNIHRTELRVVPGQNTPNAPVAPREHGLPERREHAAQDDSRDQEEAEELWVVQRREPVERVPEPQHSASATPRRERPSKGNLPRMSESDDGQKITEPEAPLPVEAGCTEGEQSTQASTSPATTLRRTTRKTAGVHPNPYNLPGPVVQPQGLVGTAAHLASSDSVECFFRPWQLSTWMSPGW